MYSKYNLVAFVIVAILNLKILAKNSSFCINNNECNKGHCNNSVCVCNPGYATQGDTTCNYKLKNQKTVVILSILGFLGADWYYLSCTNFMCCNPIYLIFASLKAIMHITTFALILIICRDAKQSYVKFRFVIIMVTLLIASLIWYIGDIIRATTNTINDGHFMYLNL